MRYRIKHITTYSGSERVSIGHNESRLKPRVCPNQNCITYKLGISPKPSYLSHGQDYYGNPTSSFSFSQGYRELKVTSESEVVVEERAPQSVESPAWDVVMSDLHRHATFAEVQAYEFTFSSPQSDYFPALNEYARKSFPAGRPILKAVQELTSRIHEDFKYDPRATTVTTAVPEVFALRSGVCQDFAHLEIAALRSLGLAARYVSGYLRTFPPPGKPRLIGADASHAWLSVYCGALGWIDVDPTNDKFASTDHITVAWGRDYGDVPPLKGVFIGGGQHTLSVSVDVAPVE